MRYVSEIKPITTGPNSSLVPGLSSVHAVKPIHSREQTVFQVTALHSKHREVVEADQEGATRLPLEDRRKACRRIHNQKVLIELRSGVDRRHHDLLGNHATEHVDEKA
ncbi:MAG: hypothetical protein C0406_07575 [Sideroxydans sp.]|nr:hypothetical protein [Sideroxydans sp.]